MTISNVYKRAAKGAELLDNLNPGWFKKIKIHELYMSNCGHCVLGQLYGSYWDGLISIELESDAYVNIEEYGFKESYRSNYGYEELDKEWKIQIQERLNHENADQTIREAS